MHESIFAAIGGLPGSKSRHDDEFVDRLSHRYTKSILIFFVITVISKQYVGDPICCWMPDHFTTNQEEYTNSFCWIRNTYYLPLDKHIPGEQDVDKRLMIRYYQWVPLILMVQAFCFYIPCIVWKTFNNRSGLNVSSIVAAGKEFRDTAKADQDNRRLRYMTQQLHRYLTSQGSDGSGCTFSLKHLISKTCCWMCGRLRGNYLIGLYILTKFLYLTNILAQLFTLNAFLWNNFHMYGVEVLRYLSSGEKSTAISVHFPKLTMCDFKVRRLGNIHRYTVQCVLPINLFNEKIYMFLWFWFVFLALVTCISLLVWGRHVLLARSRQSYIERHLLLRGRLSKDTSKKDLVRFVENYLKQDGFFVVKLVAHNTNSLTATEYVVSLWDNYLRSKESTGRPYDKMV